MKRHTKILSALGFAVVATGSLLLRISAGAEAPVQPIEFDHWQHLTKEEGPLLDCGFCHEYADKSINATIPNAATCMGCHDSMRTESPEVQKLAAAFERGEQPSWRRVCWIEKSANVYFTHKPHIAAGVECASCHGQIAQMHRVRKEVNQTMGWCIDCHRQRSASLDCYVCHR
jgi:Cytochrome c7 and related cytochrome c